MKVRSVRRRLSITALIVAAACAPGPDSNAAGIWVGTIATEGNVTTVINESGSVWGGMATLVEEASIGVDAGEGPYMLAGIASIAASDDRIYVLSTRPTVVRVYDMRGKHVRDIGGPGQGPGEFQGTLMSMVLAPNGNIVVRDDAAARITTFSPAGELIDTWPTPGGYRTAQESVVTRDGTVYVPQIVDRDAETGNVLVGMVPYDREGNAGDPLTEPQPEHEAANFPPIVRDRPGGGTRRTIMQVPFLPRPATALSPLGAWVSGVGSSYRFEVRSFEGAVMVVERRVDPFPVGSAEAEESRQRTIRRARSLDPQWTWNGPEIPAHKPYFDDLHADHSGRVWVRRRGPSSRVVDCDPGSDPSSDADPPSAPTPRCWRDESFFDLFDSDGRYLGEVPFPPFFRPFGGGFGNVFMRGDMVLMEVEDDAGTPMVKRYRLVVPGGEAPR